jgi:hypothetical protein
MQRSLSSGVVDTPQLACELLILSGGLGDGIRARNCAGRLNGAECGRRGIVNEVAIWFMPLSGLRRLT